MFLSPDQYSYREDGQRRVQRVGDSGGAQRQRHGIQVRGQQLRHQTPSGCIHQTARAL